MSFRKELKSKFPDRIEETTTLINTCKKVGLSEAQKLHLLARIFFDPEALSYWMKLHTSDPFQAERYLVRMAPADKKSPLLFDSWLLCWLKPLARAVGLIA